MTADASIYGMIRQPAPQADPLEQYAKAMTIRHMMQQGQIGDLQRQQMEKGIAEDDATSAAYRESGGDPTKLKDLLYGRGLYKPAMAVEKNTLERQKTQGEIDKTKVEVVAKSLQTHRDQLAGVTDPQAAAQWVMAGFNDPNISPIAQRFGSPQEIIAKIPQDPQGFADWKMRNGLGIEKLLEMTKPDYKTVGAGGTTVVRQMNPNAPGFSAEPIQHTATIGEQETARHNPVMEGIARGNLGVAQGHLGVSRASLAETQAEHGRVAQRAADAAGREKLSQPFEVTSSDGRQVLVQQDKNTGQLLDVNTKQPVTGVAPKLDTATEGKLRDTRQTSATLDQLIKTFDPAFVGMKGSVGEFSDKYLSQIPGMEKLAGNPDRVTFRQLSATVVNNYINQITGATVGQSGEQQRLMRAVPTPQDSPVQFHAKMVEMRRNLDELPSIIANNPNLKPQGEQRAEPRSSSKRVVVNY